MNYPCQPASVFDLLWLYQKSLDGNNTALSSVRTALLRFTAPGWGGTYPSGKKLTSSEVHSGLEFLKIIPLEQLRDALSVQEKVFKKLNVDTAAQRQARYILKKFVDWAIAQGYIEPPVDDTPELYRLRSKGGEAKDYWKKGRLENRANRQDNTAYSLGKVEGDFINDAIAKDLKDLDQFQSRILDRKSRVTRENTSEFLRRILGWMHREEGIPLESLRLTGEPEAKPLIPVIQIEPAIANFDRMDDYWMAKAKAGELVDRLAKETVERIQNYMDWRTERHQGVSIKTEQAFLDAMTCLAKFAYRDQTNTAKARDFADIPLVERLRIARTNLRKKHPNPTRMIPLEEKLIPWSEVIAVREALRKEADLEHTVYIQKKSGTLTKRPRALSGIARSMQRFLILAFFTVVPPDRQRTFRELKIGETFKHGLFRGKRFIPAEKLSPGEARFYIHLKNGDYKTSKAYGEFIGELPDEVFPDGKTFYQYLDRWLYQGFQKDDGTWAGLREGMIVCHPRHQERLASPNARKRIDPRSHNFFFLSTTGNRIDDESFLEIFTGFFKKFAGVPVTPHTLRHIFRTHLKDLGATTEQLESAAFWMKHDILTAEKCYTHQDQATKLRPAVDLMKSLNEI